MSEYTPLSEVNHGYPLEDITFGLELPDYAPSERIMVNLPKIRRIARLGGLDKVVVVNYSGDRTSFTPEIDGIDDHGTATAGGKITPHIAETNQSAVKTADGIPPYYYAYSWSTAEIDVNQEELEDSILREKGSLRDPKAWSTRVDDALKSGLRDASRQKLLGTYNRKSFRFSNGCGLVVGLISFGIPEEALDLTTKYGGVLLLQHVVSQMMNSLNGQADGQDFSQRRKSLFYGAQIDRFAAMQVLSRSSRLVKAAG